KRKPEKAHAYTFDEALRRLLPQVEQTAAEIDALPKETCPDDLTVVSWTLNPSYIAKSFFPATLLRDLGLAHVGSRSRLIAPDKWTRKVKPSEVPSTELFIAGERSRFRALSNLVPNLGSQSAGALEFAR